MTSLASRTASAAASGLRELVAFRQRPPNPVLLRELRQAARLQRTPIILATVTGLIALLMCSIGGLVSISVEPSTVGEALFHVFFSLAFAVVTWIAPAVAASTIASERSGRTWEALLLTGLSPARIARGKFAAALAYIGAYIVMLVPVGALPFLFGGITATEVWIAFAVLLLIAVLSVAFGLAVSSKFTSPAAAILVTLVVAVPLSLIGYGMLGPALSIAINELWPGVRAGAPVWLPTAFIHAPFGIEYLLLLVMVPLGATLVPAWLLYELTIANMASPADDRSTGVRVWFLVCAPLVALCAMAVGVFKGTLTWLVGCLVVFCIFILCSAFLLCAEPVVPSRRVIVHWQRDKAGRLRRYLGPGILKAMSLVLLCGLIGVLLLTAVGTLSLSWHARRWTEEAQALGAVAAYAIGIVTATTGLASWLRTVTRTGAATFVLLLLAQFCIWVGPWIALAIAGVIDGSPGSLSKLAAPSPLYVIEVGNDLLNRSSGWQHTAASGLACALSWALLGAGLFAIASGRRARIAAQLRPAADDAPAAASIPLAARANEAAAAEASVEPS